MTLLERLSSVYNADPNIIIIVSGLVVACAAVKLIYNHWPTSPKVPVPAPAGEQEEKKVDSASLLKTSKNTPEATAQSFYGVSPDRHIDAINLIYSGNRQEVVLTNTLTVDTQLLIDLDGRKNYDMSYEINGQKIDGLIHVILRDAITRFFDEKKAFYIRMLEREPLKNPPSPEQINKAFNIIQNDLRGKIAVGLMGINEDLEKSLNYKKQQARNFLISAEIYRTAKASHLEQMLLEQIIRDNAFSAAMDISGRRG